MSPILSTRASNQTPNLCSNTTLQRFPVGFSDIKNAKLLQVVEEEVRQELPNLKLATALYGGLPFRP